MNFNKDNIPMLIDPVTQAWTAEFASFLWKVQEALLSQSSDEFVELIDCGGEIDMYRQDIREKWLSTIHEYVEWHDPNKGIAIDVNVDRVSSRYSKLIGGIYVTIYWLEDVTDMLFIPGDPMYRSPRSRQAKLVTKCCEILFTYHNNRFWILPIFNKFLTDSEQY